MDRKIDFLIIGAQKAGTTSLHHYLMQHPDLFLPEAKDLQFFLNAGSYEVKERDFDLYYSKIDQEKLIGGSQVQLMYFPESANRLFEYNSDMKLIAVLRNPIERAYSAYWYAKRKAWEISESFEIAINKEADRLKGEFREQADLTYLSHGIYEKQIDNLMSIFPSSNLYIGLFDDLKNNPKQFVADIFSWLGVDPRVEIDTEQQSNKAAIPQSMLLQKFLMKPPSQLRALFHQLFPKSVQKTIQEKIVSKLMNMNEKETQYPAIGPETYKQLCDYFRPNNELLGKLINRNLDHWTEED